MIERKDVPPLKVIFNITEFASNVMSKIGRRLVSEEDFREPAAEQSKPRRGEKGQGELMSSATLQINVIPKRMLSQSEAAHHCGRSLTRFKVECPVRPLRYANGDLRWDVQDLDAWINSLKAGVCDHDADVIIARLGA